MASKKYSVIVQIRKSNSDVYIRVGKASGSTIPSLMKEEQKVFKQYVSDHNLSENEFWIDGCIWLEWPEKNSDIELYNIKKLVDRIPFDNDECVKLKNYMSDYTFSRVESYIKYMREIDPNGEY